MQSNVEVPTSSTQWKDQEIKARDADAEDYFDYCRRSLGPYGDRGQVKLVLRAVAPTRGAQVLDAGCGVGRFALPLANRVKSILAVDYSSASIEVLQGELAQRGLTNVTTDVGDLTSMELPSDTFDVAIASGVINHIPSPDTRLKPMRNTRSSLRTAGRPQGRRRRRTRRSVQVGGGGVRFGVLGGRVIAGSVVRWHRAARWRPVQVLSIFSATDERPAPVEPARWESDSRPDRPGR